jgi:hypothetical protein
MSRDELKAQLVRTFLTGVQAQWLTHKAELFCLRAWPR